MSMPFAADRREAAAHGLGDAHEVGLHADVFAGKHPAGAAEP